MATQTGPRTRLPSALDAWYWASRPYTLGASAVPVFVGTSIAARAGAFDLVLFLCTIVASVLVQVGTNLTDEYVDHRKHGGLNKFAAPHKVIMRGLLSERVVYWGIVASFGAATLLGLYLVSQAGWPILIVALASLAVAYTYSGGPMPLGDVGLGELTVFIFMGPLMVLGTYYVQTHSLAWPALWASVPVGLLVTSIMQCNNVRDIDEDRRSGKRTLARALGPRLARHAYTALVVIAYLSIAAGALLGALPLGVLFALTTFPLAIRNVSALKRATERPALNRVLMHAARLHALTGFVLAAGVVVG